MKHDLEDLQGRSIRELKLLAKDAQISKYSRLTKPELIAALLGKTPLPKTDDEKAALAAEKAAVIARLAQKIERAKAKLATERAEWNKAVKEARAALKEQIENGGYRVVEGSDEQTVVDPKVHLNGIRASWQHLCDTEAGRSEAIRPISERLAKLEKKMRAELDNVQQMDLKF